jgi:guanylate kinase
MEVDGVDYHFLTNEKFSDLKSINEIKVFQEFLISGQIWNYGITKENWENNQLFIMTRHELEQIDSEERKNCFVVYLNIEPKVRRKRLLKRADQNDSISRRIEADEKDFEGFKNYDLSITDPEFDAEWIYDLMD